MTPRTLPAQGRAGGWVEASPEPSGTASAPLAAAVGGWWANKVRFRGVCPLGGALREIGSRSSVIGRVCAAMCARWRGRWCVVGHSFGSAAVLTAAQAPRLRGARGRLRPRRPEGPEFQSPPESNLYRPNHKGPRDHPAWHIGGAENKRPQRPHPPKGARPTHRPRRRPPSDDRPALGGRARGRRAREAAAPMAQRACRGPPDVGGPTGQLPGPQAVTRRSDARRSDARPQAMAPGPHPST